MVFFSEHPFRKLILFIFFACLPSCQLPTQSPDGHARLASDDPGPVAENFALFDHLGKFHELRRESNAQAIVIVSYTIGCPIVRRALPQLEEMRRRFEPSGVRFFLLDSGFQDHRVDLIDEAKRFAIKMPILNDETQEVARSLKIDRSGEALLIDTKTWKIIARGPIDDRLGYGVDRLKASENSLAENLDNFLKGKKIEVPQKTFLGCALTFADDGSNALLTYHGQVEPIIAKKCLGCHARGLIAPDRLDTYEGLRGWSGMLREVLMSERMPPWETDRYYVHLKNDPQLSIVEKKTLLAWIRQGGAEGEAARPVKAEVVAKMSTDLRLSMKAEVKLESNSNHPWHYEELIANASQDFWITGMQLEASNP